MTHSKSIICNPTPTLPRPNWAIRAGFVVLALVAWFWTQSLISQRAFPADGIGDGLHLFSASLNQYFLEHRSAANALLITSSLFIDSLGVFLLASGIFGRSIRPFLALIILFGLRQICQGLSALPVPPNMIWHHPGFPSLLVTYGVSNDLFFSGHTAIAVLGAVELARLGKCWLAVLGVLIAIFEAATVLVLRAHYTLDVFTGAITALYVAHLADRLAPWCDRVLLRVRPASGAGIGLLVFFASIPWSTQVLAQNAPPSVAPRFQVKTYAGTGQAGYSGDGGQAAQAQVNNPFGIVRGPDGALYICDMSNHVIRKVSAEGKISTVAGTGKRGYSGDAGPARQAELNEPYEIRFDRGGNMYFVEMQNHIVRRVDAKSQIISTVAGTGQQGFSGDGGSVTQATFRQPHSIQFDRNGDLYICDIGNHRVRRVDMTTGIVSTFAGTGEKTLTPDGAAIEGAALNGPRAIDFDNDGNMWLALREGNAVYKLDLKARKIHHMAGTGKTGFTGNGGPAKDATLSGPKGLSVGPNGNIYLADTESHSIRMIDATRGTLELIAGTGDLGNGPDGDPLKCRMARPHGIFVDRDGTLFIGDSEAHRVRIIRR